MHSGYIFTESPGAAFEAYGLFASPTGARYVAQLDDGSGFVAFDDVEPGMHEFGEVRLIPQAFFWPFKAAPKRGVKQGDEWFSLVPDDAATLYDLRDMEAVSGMTILDNGLWLIESHGPVLLQYSAALNARAEWAEQRRTKALQPA